MKGRVYAYKNITVVDKMMPDGYVEYNTNGKSFLVSKENFRPDDDWYADFDRRYTDFQTRELLYNTVIHEEDYEDVHYSPYEWLLKVGTEYYYRYEGTLTVPPCYEVNHWRFFKDPIRVHPRQIAELNRLLAWRRNPPNSVNECELDTAGVLSTPDTVSMYREIQYTHKNHRMTFCECQDWPSTFSGDQRWCKKWQKDTSFARLDVPYNFDTNGEW
jgi:Eukaryotic-type carbonic anhydrase